MINNILESVKKGKYTKQANSNTAYIETKHKWISYLLADQLIFSHRTNIYTPENFPEDLHMHDYYELIICAKGKDMQYIADNKYLSVQQGTAILTKPMSVHMYRPRSSVNYDRYVIYFKPNLNIFPDSSIMNFLNKDDNSGSLFYFTENNLFCQYAEKAEYELLNSDSQYATAKALLQICNLFIALSDTNVKNTDFITSRIPDYLYEIKEYIDKEYVNISTTADLADKFHYSREYITRGFSNYFNTPLYEYILKRKLLHCCKLLKKGESVEKSAVLSGFRNMSGFTRMFRKFNGCTPSEYKRKRL